MGAPKGFLLRLPINALVKKGLRV